MKVSVIIPLRNEEEYIGTCLQSLVKQDYPKDKLEIILVDGRSEDKTKVIIDRFKQGNPNIILLDNPHLIVPYAMNLGINAASGELIVRMDAHATYAVDYISKCVEWSLKTGADNVGGPALACGQGYVGKAIEFAHYSVFGLGGGKFRLGTYSGYVDTVFLGAFRREVFEQVGFYDTRLVRNQDIELNSRIRASGGKCFLTPEIKASYFCRSTLKGLWEQNFKNGLWNIYTANLTKNALSLRHFIPLIFVLSLLISGGTAILAINYSFIFTLPFLLILGAYLFVSLVFSLQIAVAKGAGYFPILPIVFFTLHFSYGLGSIKGLFTVRHWVRENVPDVQVS